MNTAPEPTQPDSAFCPIDESIAVVIVGAGPTGLAAGNLLGMAGVATLIVERNPGLSDIPKAIALDDEGLRICQAMGLSAAINDCIVSDISVQCVAKGQLLAKVAPLSRRNGYPLISTFNQPEFEAVLLDGLRRFSCVETRFQHTVETFEQGTDCIVVSMRTPTGALQKVRCAYLLACDGGRSTVRHLLNIPMRGMTFEQKWLVIDSISLAASSPVVKIFCDPGRPAVSIPAPHNGRRWEFMLLPGETEQDMLETATISALLQQTDALPQTQIIRQAVYAFHAARAKSFSQGCVFLLGDAAHMMPPFGGQGLNSGLRDAHNLAWKIAMVLQNRAAPQLLSTYDKERSRHAAQMIAFASFLGTLFMSSRRSLAYCRNRLIQMLFALPVTRAYFREIRIKPRAKYTAGFFLFNWRKKRLVGSLLPQPEVINQHGQRVLLDEVLGTGFALLRRHSNPEEAFASVNSDFWENLGTLFVCIQSDDAPLKRSAKKRTLHYSSYQAPCESQMVRSSPIVVIRSAHKDFPGVSQDYFVVVRPDRFILGIFKEEEADAFVSAFQRLLQQSA
ncbi:MAG TPA: FAD-dependent monooxygenase [Ktedonobacteraceae bacterium]|nr:FAD-dependent monooxygenase [Ktedonobacteraceae bacterium]